MSNKKDGQNSGGILEQLHAEGFIPKADRGGEQQHQSDGGHAAKLRQRQAQQA